MKNCSPGKLVLLLYVFFKKITVGWFFFHFYAVEYSFAGVFVSGKYCRTVFLSVKQGEGTDEMRNACRKKMSYASHLHFQITSIFKIHKNISKPCSGVEKPFYFVYVWCLNSTTKSFWVIRLLWNFRSPAWGHFWITQSMQEIKLIILLKLLLWSLVAATIIPNTEFITRGGILC